LATKTQFEPPGAQVLVVPDPELSGTVVLAPAGCTEPKVASRTIAPAATTVANDVRRAIAHA
jgi:hypothetical protein